jgi:hypothetical protein
MRHPILSKVRLSWFFVFFFLVYALLAMVLPKQKFESGALTLFSVNSFLYGFYISPILSAQKARIEELHKIVRAEANAMFAMVLMTKNLSKDLRTELQNMFTNYMQGNIRDHRKFAETAYERLITYAMEYKGKERGEMDKLLDKLVANQQNRTNLSMQLNNRVFNNEWMIILMLFSITLSFIMLLDTGDGLIFKLVAALLCTGLTMLLVILAKLSTLTHKKAREIWTPFQKLLSSRFYRID